jgi:uncharacterized membrane protein YqjE
MNHVNAAGKAAGRNRSTSELVQVLTEQVSVLVRDEMRLAQLELARKGKQAGKGIGLLGGGGLIALYGVACLIACAIIAVSQVLRAWLAALVVGAALLAVAAVVAWAGKARVRKASPPVPTEAIASVRTDVAEIRERARR